jgi:hypothetical protein
MTSQENTSSLVSIVLPTWNGDTYLEDAIASCLGQTWQNLELVIVDDGSTNPATAKILGRVSDSRVRIFRQEPNGGLPAALNRGFAEARGAYLTWTSDDNRFYPEAIEKMLGFLRETNADFVYAPFRPVDENDEPVGEPGLPPLDFLPIQNCVGACFLYSRQVMEMVGEYDTEARLAEDYDYWARAYKRFKMRRLDAVLYDYRFHGGNLTAEEGTARVEEKVAEAARRHFSPSEILAARALRAYWKAPDGAALRLLVGALLRRPFDGRLYKPFFIALLPGKLVRCFVGCKKRLVS